ncbi:NAD-P-binding protein [Amylocystis lapponica]|nr:NAD-P-binding protein [Amylocystis lapponica]
MSSPAKRVWFITGSSSGFGRAMVERVLQNGDIAVATLRNPTVLTALTTQYPTSQLLVVKLDVTKPEDISVAFDAARVAFGRIDVVFNNAAYGMLSEVEGAADATVRAMFEVDFWGAANISRAAVAFFRDVNKPRGGRLLQISSMAGIEGSAGIGYYSASKFAFEGLSEALAAELDPEWNIKITLVEPGGFKTDGLSRMDVVPPHPAYIKPTLKSSVVRKWLGGDPVLRGDTAKATALFYKLVALPDPPLHLPLGKDSLALIKRKTTNLLADVEKYESWSDDIEREDVQSDSSSHNHVCKEPEEGRTIEVTYALPPRYSPPTISSSHVIWTFLGNAPKLRED